MPAVSPVRSPAVQQRGTSPRAGSRRAPHVPSGRNLAYAGQRMSFALLGRLLDLEGLLRRDEQRSSEELMREDQALLGPELPADAAQALERWLAGRRREHAGRTV